MGQPISQGFPSAGVDITPASGIQGNQSDPAGMEGKGLNTPQLSAQENKAGPSTTGAKRRKKPQGSASSAPISRKRALETDIAPPKPAEPAKIIKTKHQKPAQHTSDEPLVPSRLELLELRALRADDGRDSTEEPFVLTRLEARVLRRWKMEEAEDRRGKEETKALCLR